MKNNIFKVFTDGACKSNPGPGGWGWIVYFSNGSSISDYGGEKSTTNNKMEMMAILESLKFCRKWFMMKNYEHVGGTAVSPLSENVNEKNFEIHIHTDSQYCMKSIVEKSGDTAGGEIKFSDIPNLQKINYKGWLGKWIDSDFKGKKNVNEWKQIDYWLKRLILDRRCMCKIYIHYVKAHVGIEGNEIADALANKGVPKK